MRVAAAFATPAITLNGKPRRAGFFSAAGSSVRSAWRAAAGSPWPFVCRVGLAVASSMRGILGREAQAPSRSPEGVHAGEEPLEHAVRVLGTLDLRYVPAPVEREVLRGREPVLHVTAE